MWIRSRARGHHRGENEAELARGAAEGIGDIASVRERLSGYLRWLSDSLFRDDVSSFRRVAREMADRSAVFELRTASSGRVTPLLSISGGIKRASNRDDQLAVACVTPSTRRKWVPCVYLSPLARKLKCSSGIAKNLLSRVVPVDL